MYLAFFIATAILLFSGLIGGWGYWYSPDVALRLQTDALLSGRLSLASSPGAVLHDFVWDAGRSQQVWGLGVPFWRLPFEGVAKLFGYRGFPDRIAFWAMLMLVSVAVLRGFLAPPIRRELNDGAGRGDEGWEVWVGFSLLVLFPPFLTLLGSERFEVYHEVYAYNYLLGVTLLVGIVLFVRDSRFWKFLVLAALAGVAAFVRPTAGAFGGAALVVLLIRGYGLNWPWRRLGAGIGLFIGGWVLLWGTNWARFGTGFEFGHNLNLNYLPTARFVGRFEDPYRSESILSAARELGSLLFFQGAYYSEAWRMRPRDTESYGISYLVFLIVVVAWFAGRCRQMFRQGKLLFGQNELLALWCILSTALLTVFYLRFPFISSNYLLDFAPGFAAGVLAFTYVLRDWGVPRFGPAFKWFLVFGVVSWWCFQITFGTEYWRGTFRVSAVTQDEMIQRMENQYTLYREIPSMYETGMVFSEYVNEYNGSGWDSDSGDTRAAILLFVEEPGFLELEVSPAAEIELGPEDYQIIRAKVALEFLNLEDMTRTEEGMVLRFSGPKRKRYENGIQVVFVAFMTAEELHEGWSRFRLLRVRWREEG